MVQILSGVILSSILLGSTLAHPGHDGTAGMTERAAYMATLQNKDLSHCASSLAQSGVLAKMVARRAQLAATLREERGLDDGHYLRARDFATVLATNHHSNLTSLDPATAKSSVFGVAKDAILSPQTTEGPYYVTGELIRSDVTEGQKGVEAIIDVQVIDYTTCKPLSGVAIDFWHCNATGVYGGIVARGNGNANDAANINNTMLRGIQTTDSSGVVTFKSVVPGHYTGRTNHVHILSHINATVLPNNTVTGGTVAHAGQVFFDQSLLDQVETVAPYASNTQARTLNANDGIIAGASATDDPVLEYVFLGTSVAQGIFGWINIGINASYARSVSAASTYSNNGGYKNPNGGMGGGPGGMGGPPGGFGAGFPSGRPTGRPSGPPGSRMPPRANSTALASASPMATASYAA